MQEFPKILPTHKITHYICFNKRDPFTGLHAKQMEKTQETTTPVEKDNILTSYSAGNPDHPEWFIYEYHTGRKVLVERDTESGKVHFLKEL